MDSLPRENNPYRPYQNPFQEPTSISIANMSLAKLQYYDKPEGQDAFGKMVATNRYAAVFGLTMSAYDVLMVSKPSGYAATLGRFAYITGPCIGMATAFTMTTLATTKLRGKCDTLNYVAGALASASVFGAWRRSVVAGCTAGLVFCEY